MLQLVKEKDLDNGRNSSIAYVALRYCALSSITGQVTTANGSATAADLQLSALQSIAVNNSPQRRSIPEFRVRGSDIEPGVAKYNPANQLW
jgi:hypothetical protein